MWRVKSFTFWLNLILLGLGIYLDRAELYSIAIINLGLREKTQRKIK